MGRNILFITTDQQRYDPLGATAGRWPAHRWHNLWDDPADRALCDDLVADLDDSLPAEVRRDVEAVG